VTWPTGKRGKPASSRGFPTKPGVQHWEIHAWLAAKVLGQAGTTTCANPNAAGAGPFFYQVAVKSL
jgi:hypothetical protein